MAVIVFVDRFLPFIIRNIFFAVILLSFMKCSSTDKNAKTSQSFTVNRIGEVVKENGHTYIIIDKEYEPGLLRMEQLSEIWVLWWFDRNDTPQQRSILQVHPKGDPNNPLTGVFATHSPVRPNLIAMTRCKIISVTGNVIEIESIDAFPDTPVLDIKS